MTLPEIPRVIHQVWVGPNEPPTYLMASWRHMHPGWEYRLWTSYYHDPIFDPLRHAIEAAPEWCGKADCMRYCILREHGGVYVDADSECLRPIDALFLERPQANGGALAAFEHELVRPGVLANGFIAVPPQHETMAYCVNAITNLHVDVIRNRGAQHVLGGYLLTEAWCGAPTLPARLFYPVHWTGAPAPGDMPPYARQMWGSTVGHYDDGVTPDGPIRRELRDRIARIEAALGLTGPHRHSVGE